MSHWLARVAQTAGFDNADRLTLPAGASDAVARALLEKFGYRDTESIGGGEALVPSGQRRALLAHGSRPRDAPSGGKGGPSTTSASRSILPAFGLEFERRFVARRRR